MDEDIAQKIRTRLAELPEDVQQAVTSADVGQRIQKLGAKHSLHVDQIGALGDETYMVMLGFTDPAEFDDTLTSQLNIPKEKAEALAQDVSNEIFMPIRESMQEFMEERAILQAVKEGRSEAPAAQKPPPAAPTPSATPAAAPAPAATPKPAADMHAADPSRLGALAEADMMLSQKTASVAPQAPSAGQDPTAGPKPAPQTPKSYTNDPYREPPL